MKVARFFGIVLSLCSFCRAQAIIQTPAGQVSMASIQEDFDAQKYPDVVRKTTVALNYKGPSSAQFDKAKLYMLKAEAHLRLKQFVPAADTFTLAAKESKDEKEIALAKSTALLIRRSVGGQYSPKSASATQPAAARGTKAPPIGIVDPESRGKAMAALFDDELKIAIPKIQAASKQASLPPLMNSINEVRDLRMLEMTATGQDTSTAQLFGGLENRAGQLMGDAIKTMSAKVEQISTHANEGSSHFEESPYGGRRTVTHKNGLTSNDSDMLKEAIDTSKKIAATCEEFAKVLPAGTSQSGAMATVNADTSRLADRADQVLHTNYDPEIADSPAGTIVLPPQVTPVVPGGRGLRQGR